MENYENLLERVYKNIPKREQSAERFEVPELEVFQQGNKTIVRNFTDVCSVLRRDPKDIAKYLSRELAVPSNIEGKRLIFNGKVDNRLLSSKMSEFINKNIKCKVCGSYDTHFESLDRHTKIMKCEACGAQAPVRL